MSSDPSKVPSCGSIDNTEEYLFHPTGDNTLILNRLCNHFNEALNMKLSNVQVSIRKFINQLLISKKKTKSYTCFAEVECDT